MERVPYVLGGLAVATLGMLLVLDYRGISTKLKDSADAARQRGRILRHLGPSASMRQVGALVIFMGLFFAGAAVFGRPH
ncbi:hypothetical protein ACFW1A_10280 [Kitasatospora sp. NPDC058965]|uniref:hypothetical protein n=1 Tax=Kitasatospora sp. NPDC058965 TaxID=3346682 RepID=UPI0036BDA681